jgi:hypothetical protein
VLSSPPASLASKKRTGRARLGFVARSRRQAEIEVAWAMITDVGWRALMAGMAPRATGARQWPDHPDFAWLQLRLAD